MMILFIAFRPPWSRHTKREAKAGSGGAGRQVGTSKATGGGKQAGQVRQAAK